MSGFHEVRFPTRLAFGSGVGIERKTDIVALSSGREQRFTPWALGRRHYLIGSAVRNMVDAADIVAFFEARRGRLFGFRFKDFSDFKSCPQTQNPSATDQVIGIGDGAQRAFSLKKAYGDVARPITKPVLGTVKIALNGVSQNTGWSVDITTGEITFLAAPATGVEISAGFEFDTPVRFDADRLDMTLESFDASKFAAISLVEIRP